MNKLQTIFLALLVLVIGGCATVDTLNDDEKNAAFETYIAEHKLESIKHIKSFNFKGWSTLTDDYLILSSSFNKRYLIQLKNSCYDLDSSYSLGLKQSMTSRLSVNTDAVVVFSHIQIKCFIKAIYPIDKAAVKTLQAIGKAVKEDSKKG